MFASTIELFDAYYRMVDALQVAGFSRDLGCEVRERLKQLDYAISKVKALEHSARSAQARSEAAFLSHIEDVKSRGVSYEDEPMSHDAHLAREEIQASLAAEFEMKFLTEAFYYFAGRVRTILRNSKAPLPGLTTFECEGVRNTRNKLLEHAEGSDSQVFIQSFGWGGAQGPVIKAIRYGGQEHVFPDRGLYENAEEFRINLESRISSVLAGA